ncbi:putative aquaporin SIP2-1 [Bidens hawaiensis]|uniref:putative aquaporin SIP2-1 n=1 Tax=Bidens hawaiensis TaxID=980011 RepID=UPI00404B6BB6
MAGIGQLIVTDTVLSFMWVWASVIIRIIVQFLLGFRYGNNAYEFCKCSLSLANMFLFAYLVKLGTNGGAYNPIVVVTSAVNGNFITFLLNVGRIPFQVLGSIIGVRLILETFPELWYGPELVINLHQGALTEGLLTFVHVLITLGLDRNIDDGSFFMKTWISSILKLALHTLGSDLTGGCMNPAAVVGWAYALGIHKTKEHIIVYWLAPMEACLLAVWTFRLLVRGSKPGKQKTN